MSVTTVRSVREVEALVPGFLAAMEAFDAATDYEGDDPVPFEEWFEGRKAVVTVDAHRAWVTVYESTGGYCDEWSLLQDPTRWVHSEAGQTLVVDTGAVRPVTTDEIGGPLAGTEG